MAAGVCTSFQAPGEFEDAAQMAEWLILLESKLQPERITVGNFVQLRRMQRDLQVGDHAHCWVATPTGLWADLCISVQSICQERDTGPSFRLSATWCTWL